MPKGKPNKRYTPEFKIMVVETIIHQINTFEKAGGLIITLLRANSFNEGQK